jgi:molybdopterin synthase catalytic subunit
MKTHLAITTAPSDLAKLQAQRESSAAAGAVVSFVGLVRGTEQGQAISGLEYEAFQRMAEHQFEQIFLEVERHWPILTLHVVHRIGAVRVGEASLWIEVSPAHRQ